MMNKKSEWARYIEKYPWLMSFYKARQRCINPNQHGYKNYGGRGIKLLLTREDIKFLWFRDKAYEMDRPSIDRIDSNGHYILENCRFIELIKNSIMSAFKRRKPILQFDLNGKFIREWSGTVEACQVLNICGEHIPSVLYYKRKSACGYIWRFKNDN